MPRETLDREIHQLQDEMLLLGSMVEQSMLDAVDALKRRDIPTSKRIYAADRQINERRFAIENATLIIIATQQPMAHDLRLLAAILEITNELERMGDYAKGIAKISALLGETSIVIPNREFAQMAEQTVSMLHRSLASFISEDIEAAHSIPGEDDLVDELYNKIYHILATEMLANPEIIDHANYLMWAAHNLERMADRVTNICERTVFVSTGEMVEIKTSDDEFRSNIQSKTAK
jgi:phosphate transport system protein